MAFVARETSKCEVGLAPYLGVTAAQGGHGPIAAEHQPAWPAASSTGSTARSFLRSGQVEPRFRLRLLDRGASAKAPNGCCGLRCERPWLECLAGLLSLPALRPCCFGLNTP